MCKLGYMYDEKFVLKFLSQKIFSKLPNGNRTRVSRLPGFFTVTLPFRPFLMSDLLTVDQCTSFLDVWASSAARYKLVFLEKYYYEIFLEISLFYQEQDFAQLL